MESIPNGLIESLVNIPGDIHEKINVYLKLRTQYDIDDIQVDKNLLQQDKTRMIFLSNLLPGPLILPTRTRGHGLFAEKDYDKTEFVTRYGGLVGNKNVEGPYVVYNPRTKHTVDGEYDFLLSEKGRWVNEYAKKTRERKKFTNVTMKYDDQGMYFRTIGIKVPKGQEFFWDYGKDYDRSAYVSECLVCQQIAFFVCGGCKNAQYCDTKCQKWDWTHNKHYLNC